MLNIIRNFFILQLYSIWTWLPTRYAVCQPLLLYTSEEHGTSLVTLYSRVENYQPTIIVIKNTENEVRVKFYYTVYDSNFLSKPLPFCNTTVWIQSQQRASQTTMLYHVVCNKKTYRLYRKMTINGHFSI